MSANTPEADEWRAPEAAMNRGSDTEVAYASPATQLTAGFAANGRPGPDGRKRRYRNSSDDPDCPLPVDGFITEDLRAGGPYLCGIPLYGLPVPENHPLSVFVHKDSLKFRGHVESILASYDVEHKSFNICTRQSKYHPEKSPVPTLLVHANRHELDNSWVNACRALSEYLKREGQEGVCVEIADLRVYHPLQYSSVLPTDDIFPIWDQVLEAILENIGLEDINAAGCYRVGKSLDKTENPPTVHIMVARGSSRPWKDVREAVVNILNGFNLGAVGVMIVNGETRQEDDISLRDLPRLEGEVRAQVGMSMGISNSKTNSSTFGGFLEVYLPNAKGWSKLGLTCFRCVDPQNKEDVQHGAAHHSWGRDGVKPGNSEAPRQMQLDMPSLKDFNYRLEILGEHVKEAKKATKNEPRYIQVQKALDSNDDISPNDKRLYDQIKGLLAHHCNLKEALENFRSTTGLSLGHVYAASGYQERCLRTVSNHRPSILDWVLIQVNQSRMGDNTVATYGPSWPLVPFQPGCQLFDSASTVPDANACVFKVGRSTVYTEGRYSGLKEAHISEARNAAGATVKKVTLEHTVVGVGGKHFSRLGDAGALVFRGSGAFVGMLFAGSLEHPISYITLAEDLFDDIKRVTGATDVRVAEG